MLVKVVTGKAGFARDRLWVLSVDSAPVSPALDESMDARFLSDLRLFFRAVALVGFTCCRGSVRLTFLSSCLESTWTESELVAVGLRTGCALEDELVVAGAAREGLG